MRKVLSATGARVVDRELPVGKADSALDENGRLVDEDLEALLGEILAELRGEVEARREALAQAA
jgi:chromate reductase